MRHNFTDIITGGLFLFAVGVLVSTLHNHGLYSPKTADPMNKLLFGIADKTEQFLETSKSGFLLLDDGTLADDFLQTFPRARSFDPEIHSFNPLTEPIGDFMAQLDAISTAGPTTLTRRNENYLIRKVLRLLPRKSTLLDAQRVLMDPSYRDRLIGELHNEYQHRSWTYIRNTYEEVDYRSAVQKLDDLLDNDVIRSVSCKPTNFPFRPNSSIIAKLDRAKLGDDVCFILALWLIGQHKGQVIVRDGGFFLRPLHISLIRQERLTVGLQSLSEVPPSLRQAVLSIKDKLIYRTSLADAKELIIYTNHTEPRNLFEQRGEDHIESL